MALTQQTLFTLLVMLTSEISEECLYSSWESGLEYVLWDAVLDKPSWSRQQQITPRQRQMLRELSEEIDGWAVWSNRETEPRCVSIAEWQRLYAENSRQ